jgi:NitT/TauT family transport system substrate-binding protein
MWNMPYAPKLTRRAAGALAASAFVMALAGQVAPAEAADALKVRLDWSTHGIHAPFFLAKEKGWFQAAGLDVTIEDGNGSTTTVQLVGTGQFDVGHASLAPMAIAAAKGLPVISVAGFLRKGDMGILVPAESGIKKPADLEGKTVVYTAGSLEGPFLAPFFKMTGAAPDKINLLNVEAAAKVTTYLSGKVDAAVSTVPYFLPLGESKRPSRGILMADYGMNLPGFGLVVNKRTLAEKKDAIKRFASVIAGSWEYIYKGHEDEAVAAIVASRPSSPIAAPLLRKQIDAYRDYFDTEHTKGKPIGVQTEPDWVGTIEQMEAANVIAKGSKPRDYFTNDFVDLAWFRKTAGLE